MSKHAQLVFPSVSGSHATPPARAFVGVVSHSHVQRGVAGGFAQLCHGKQAPLMGMRAGDCLIYYSPATEMRGGEPLRAFTAIGHVVGEQAYKFEMAPDFVPYRRDIAYLRGKPAPLASLSGRLHFTQPGQNWGLLARRGHFEIDLHDRDLIAAAMQVDLGSGLR
jgi:hypothetical protein